MAGGMFWEMRQQSNIAGAASDARSAQSAAESAASNVAHLEAKLERLTMITKALWSIVQEREQLSEQDLLKRVEDQLQTSASTQNCSQCNRVMNKRHTKCMYCGAEKTFDSIFDAL